MVREKFVVFLLINVLLFVVIQNVESLDNTDKARIKAGLKAAQAFSKAMKVLDAVKWIATVGSVAAPVLSVVLLAVDFAFSFLGIESPEMIAMKQEFGNLNVRLDQFSVQFEEVKRKIDWSAIQLTYEKYESSVRVLNQDRIRLTSVEPERLEEERRRFIRKFESNFHLASEKLHLAMSSDSALSNNIFDAARVKTQNHERQTIEFMKGTVQLLLQAYSVQITYIKLRFNDTKAVEYFQRIIDTKMKSVQENAERVHRQIRDIWSNQMKKDVTDFIIMKKGISNRVVAEQLYRFLEDKFPWRDWFSLVYADAEDSRKHSATNPCGGIKLFRHGLRNTVVASVAKKDNNTFFTTWAHDQMRSLKKFRVKSAYGERIIEEIRKFNVNTCSPAAVMAVVRRKDHRKFDADAWVFTDRNRLHFEPFCVYKCNTDLCWIKKDKCFAVLLWG